MRGTLLSILVFVSYVLSGSVFAVSDELLIIEIQTESAESATDEKVVIRNNTSSEYDLSGLVVQYKSANGSSWSTKAELIGVVESLREVALLTTDESLKSGMSATGGHLRLYNQELEIEYDLVGWGSASEPLVSAVDPHEKGGKLLRKVNNEGELVNTKDNSQDFYAENPIQEQESESVSDPYDIIGVSNQPHELKASLEKQELQNTVFPTLSVTELMPDPVTPLTDADDEFIEIYNPNFEPINIEGYSLKTTKSNKSFVLPAFVLQPGQYLAIFSEDSGLSLSNSSSSGIEVLAPNSKVVFTTKEYEEAEAGDSFIILDDGSWVWTTTPTPSELNQLTYEVIEPEKVKQETIAKDEDGVVNGLSTNDGRDYSDLDNRDVYQAPAAIPRNKTNLLILATVGGSTIIYAAWEYRHDIRNTIYKLRGNLPGRSKASESD